MQARVKIAGFIRRTISGEDTITSFHLKHLNAEKKGSAIAKCEWKKDKDPDEIAESLINSAQDDVDGIGGVQSYIVQAMAEKTFIARCTFRLRGEIEDADDDEFESEGASLKGIVGQLMRHNEAFSRTVITIVGVHQTQAEGFMKSMADRLNNYESRHFEMLNMLEDMHSQKHERELERMKTEAKLLAVNEAWGTIAPLLPTGLSMAAKKLGLGIDVKGALPPSLLALKQVIRGMTPTKLDKIREVLSAEEQIALLEFVKSMQDEEDERDNKNKKAIETVRKNSGIE